MIAAILPSAKLDAISEIVNMSRWYRDLRATAVPLACRGAIKEATKTLRGNAMDGWFRIAAAAVTIRNLPTMTFPLSVSVSSSLAHCNAIGPTMARISHVSSTHVLLMHEYTNL